MRYTPNATRLVGAKEMHVLPEARQILASLEFRMPMLRRNVEPLNEKQMRWIPGPGRVSIAWQLWHIAEVEDNWVRDLVLGLPSRFPFNGVQAREARDADYPTKAQLIEYLHEARSLTRQRLEAMSADDFEREVCDKDYGPIAVRDVWAGVVTSFAWHAGQIALTAKLLPDSPVETMTFRYWRR